MAPGDAFGRLIDRNRRDDIEVVAVAPLGGAGSSGDVGIHSAGNFFVSQSLKTGSFIS